jgi:alkylation response protein AidB-like acyl-CoA dehydrogenase
MDLELTDEQQWLSEAVDTLLRREWVGAEQAATAGDAERAALWTALLGFGALSVDRDDGLGAVELCLIARALGTHLAAVPFVGSATVRFAAEPLLDDLPEAFGALAAGDDAVAVALLEPGRGWHVAGTRTTVGPDGLSGRKAAVEHAAAAQRVAVVAAVDGEPGLALIPADAPGLERADRPGLDGTLPLSALELTRVAVEDDAVASGAPAARLLRRLTTTGGLLVAAEAVGAASRLLDDARAYAGERRQFGHTIGSYQSLRHILADMYVRQASMWSTVLYAAAALDDELADAEPTAAVAKAYVARSAREVAHGALQVFGGVAFTEEHVAHRFLRRIVVREQQFGDAAHHERELGRLLAARAGVLRDAEATPTVTPAPVT